MTNRVLCWLVLLTVCCFASLDGNSQNESRITKILNEDGWSVPGIDAARLLSPRTTHIKGTISYEEAVLELPDPYAHVYDVAVVDVDSKAGLLLYRNLHIVVLKIRRFEVKGKSFAYHVTGVITTYNPETKAKMGYGGEMDFVYYDESGNGKFTLLDTQSVLIPWDPEIPSWVSQR